MNIFHIMRRQILDVYRQAHDNLLKVNEDTKRYDESDLDTFCDMKCVLQVTRHTGTFLIVKR